MSALLCGKKTGAGGIRTPVTQRVKRFSRPLPENHNPLSNKPLTENPKTDLAENFALILAKHPDLAKVVESWSRLPENIKAAIRVLIEGG